MNPDIPLSEIMTQNLITVNPDTPIAQIHEIFGTYTFHHIPVLDKGMLIGIVSKQDFLQVRHALRHSWDGELTNDDWYQNFVAEDIMTEYPMHLSPDDSVGLAADIFLANKFHALPILDDTELVGIVTAHDLISYAFASPTVENE